MRRKSRTAYQVYRHSIRMQDESLRGQAHDWKFKEQLRGFKRWRMKDDCAGVDFMQSGGFDYGQKMSHMGGQIFVKISKCRQNREQDKVRDRTTQ